MREPKESRKEGSNSGQGNNKEGVREKLGRKKEKLGAIWRAGRTERERRKENA